MKRRKIPLEAPPEEGFTVGAAHLGEKGKFEPKDEKKAVMVALRKLGRRDLRKLLDGKVTNQDDSMDHVMDGS